MQYLLQSMINMRYQIYIIVKENSLILMGSQCSTLDTRSKDYEFIKSFDHYSLGRLKIVRKINSSNASNRYSSSHIEQIGVKQLYFDSSTKHKQCLNFLKQVQQFDNIPTLVKVLSFETKVGGQNDTNRSLYQNEGQFTFSKNSIHQKNVTLKCSENLFPLHADCLGKYHIRVFFRYFQPTLFELMHKKQTSLQQFSQYNSISAPKILNGPNSIKLCDYQSIDSLGNTERKIINMYYQQVEILRMVDHIIGALYFLHHFGYPHGAVCSENIMIDQEGKYVLIDPQVFCLPTNYQRALNLILDRNQRETIALLGSQSESQQLFPKKLVFSYIAPELYGHLKVRYTEHKQNSQKIDIYSVGMIALKMCLVDHNIESKIFSKENMQLKKNQITKLLLQARNRYSPQLIDLIRQMIQFAPTKRIDYSALIDKLHPLLTENLDKIQKLYHVEKHSSKKSESTDSHSMEFVRRLSEFQNKYQRVISHSLLQSEKYEPFNQQCIIKDEKNILKHLKESLRSKNNPKVHNGMKKSQLYDLYLNQYQNIKRNRNLA